MGQTSSAEPVVPTDTKGTGPEVFLNVYEPTDEKSRGVMGFGVYHTGIQIGSTEYAYGGGSVSASGVYTQTPKQAPPGSNWKYKMSQSLGKSTLDNITIRKAIDKVSVAFPADKYDMLRNNCNHFTEEFAKELGVSVNYPSWVNRAAKMGAAFSADPRAAQQQQQQEATKSVFASSKGYSLTDGTPTSSASSVSASASSSTPTTGAAGGSGNGARRPNPWADKNFKPPGSTVLTSQAGGAAAPATGSNPPAGKASPWPV